MESDTAYTWNGVPNNPPQKGTDMSAKKLYEITTANGTEYGHKLAVDSTGKWVMEIKGTGTVLAMDKNKVTEVLPYTIGIKFLGSGNKTVYQYLAEVGTVEAGGLYLYESLSGMAFVHIVEVDTRSTAATTHFKPIAKIKMEVV
jgi:hypothetical protein